MILLGNEQITDSVRRPTESLLPLQHLYFREIPYRDVLPSNIHFPQLPDVCISLDLVVSCTLPQCSAIRHLRPSVKRILSRHVGLWDEIISPGEKDSDLSCDRFSKRLRLRMHVWASLPLPWPRLTGPHYYGNQPEWAFRTKAAHRGKSTRCRRCLAYQDGFIGQSRRSG
jgi:hypothetical protein